MWVYYVEWLQEWKGNIVQQKFPKFHCCLLLSRGRVNQGIFCFEDMLQIWVSVHSRGRWYYCEMCYLFSTLTVSLNRKLFSTWGQCTNLIPLQAHNNSWSKRVELYGDQCWILANIMNVSNLTSPLFRNDNHFNPESASICNFRNSAMR